MVGKRGSMTREEAIAKIKHSIVSTRDCEGDYIREFNEALEMAIKALERNPYDFAIWVAREIFDENWEYNKEAFAELACRKLAKLGIVIRMGDEWELIESLERSDKE